MKKDKGIFYVVATPIGNLKDISLRAIETLKSCSIIAAEDTRRASKLLNFLEIRAKIISCHEYNELKRLNLILETVNSGKNVCYLTDAGSPGISDPGAKLVSALRREGINILPVPGPSAVSCALSVSGIRANAYFFGGFLPTKDNEKRQFFKFIKGMNIPVVIFEAPHRLKESLKLMLELLGDIEIFFAREMTKRFEEYQLIPLSVLLKSLEPKEVKGEITLVLPPIKTNAKKEAEDTEEIKEFLKVILGKKKMGTKALSKMFSKVFSIPSGKIYELLLELERETEN